MIMTTSTGITTEATIATAAVASVRLRISPFMISMTFGKLKPKKLGELLMSNILFAVNEAATRAPAHATYIYRVGIHMTLCNKLDTTIIVTLKTQTLPSIENS